MKKALLILSLFPISWGSFSADSYSIYLVRHAEKLNDIKNPALTACGKNRAQQLASLLSKAEVESIYSTSYQRTMQTARPFAKQQKMVIRTYHPKELEQLALQLKHNKENTLVVGHSNTTPVLVELLSQQTVAPLTEQDFQYLYQIQFINEQAVLTILQQPLDCSSLQTDKHKY